MSLITQEVANDMTRSFIENSINILDYVKLGEANHKGQWIHVLREGRWNHPIYGLVEVTTKVFDNLIRNFKDHVRGIDIAVDTEHKEDKGASGWVRKVEKRPTGLWAFVEWTKKGSDLVKDKVYRYISAEFSPKYEDQETRQKFDHTMLAVTLTNRPFIKRLTPVDGRAPVMLAEDSIYEELVTRGYLTPPEEDGYEFSEKTKNKSCKDGDVDKDEREPVKSIKLKKNLEGGKKMEFGDVESGIEFDETELAEYMEFTDVEDEDTQEFDEVDDDEDTGVEYDGMEDDKDDEPQRFSEDGMNLIDKGARYEVNKLSEKVMMLEREKNQLQDTLKLSAVEEVVDSWIEDSNGVGKIMPAQKDTAVCLLMDLPNKQARMFSEFVENLPGAIEYGEKGVSNTIELSEGVELQQRARQLYETSERNGQKANMAVCLRTAYKEIYS